MEMTEQEPVQSIVKKRTIGGMFRNIVDKGHQIAVDKADKSKNEAYVKRLEKYAPVYAEEFGSGTFHMPNIILIEDDSKRRDVDVLENAIGWRTKVRETGVFHLFEDMVEQTGLVFLPHIQCNAFYYVDSFDKNRYIKIDCIFAISRDEKLAELKNIAYCLGAKKCTIEIIESHTNTQRTKKEALIRLVKGTEQREKYKSEENSGIVVVEFEGSNNPAKPELKWFAYDQNIIKLIEARCSRVNSIKTESVKLYGRTCSAMSQKTACEIDMVVAKIGNSKMSIETQSTAESESLLVYNIEF